MKYNFSLVRGITPLTFFLLLFIISTSCSPKNDSSYSPLQTVERFNIPVNNQFKPNITPRFISISKNYIYILTWRPSGLYKFSKNGELIDVLSVENLIDLNFYKNITNGVQNYHETYEDYITEAVEKNFVNISQFSVHDDVIVGFGYALFPTKRIIGYEGQKAIKKEYIKHSFMVTVNADFEHLQTVKLSELNRSLTSSYVGEDTIVNAIDFLASEISPNRLRLFTRVGNVFEMSELPKRLKRIQHTSTLRPLMKDSSSLYTNISFLNHGKTIVSDKKVFFLNAPIVGELKDSLKFEFPILGVAMNGNGFIAIDGVPIPNDTLLKSYIRYFPNSGESQSKFLDYNINLSNP